MTDKPSISPTIRQWEEAGASLTTALSNYFHLSLALGTNASRDDYPSRDLAARIDLALNTLHVTLDQQNSQARSALASTRNRILSSVNRLPNEVLSEIFAHVIYTPQDPLEPAPMKQSLLAMYRSIYKLLRVCSVWKKIILARGSFWSVIPITFFTFSGRYAGDIDPTNICIGRAQGGDLHLAAVLPSETDPGRLLDLTEHAPRFRTVNILSESCYSIGLILHTLRNLGSSANLSDLSIRYKRDNPQLNRLPREHDYIFSSSTNSHVFEGLLKRISVLRLSGAPISWAGVSFSSQLVELELQDFTLGHDSKLSMLMTALSSATQLQHLQIISAKTFPDDPSSTTEPTSKISLPNLKTLLVRDLYFNTLHYLLSSITSRSHRLFLHLTRRTFEQAHPASEPVDVSAQDVLDLFGELTVDTLLLEAEEDDPWLAAEGVWEVLHAMPDVKHLLMHNWDYYKNFCEAIHNSSMPGSSFPSFKSMYFSGAKIRDEAAFRNMVASYSESLERMQLGAMIGDGSEFTDAHCPVEESEDLATWLEDHVPDFELIGEYYPLADFLPLEWQLW
ncbi:unnamed protein product [Rhizoctonia solani]|nr:unnamed protein product [Rhizoctonia solani]